MNVVITIPMLLAIVLLLKTIHSTKSTIRRQKKQRTNQQKQKDRNGFSASSTSSDGIGNDNKSVDSHRITSAAEDARFLMTAVEDPSTFFLRFQRLYLYPTLLIFILFLTRAMLDFLNAFSKSILSTEQERFAYLCVAAERSSDLEDAGGLSFQLILLLLLFAHEPFIMSFHLCTLFLLYIHSLIAAIIFFYLS